MAGKRIEKLEDLQLGVLRELKKLMGFGRGYTNPAGSAPHWTSSMSVKDRLDAGKLRLAAAREILTYLRPKLKAVEAGDSSEEFQKLLEGASEEQLDQAMDALKSRDDE